MLSQARNLLLRASGPAEAAATMHQRAYELRRWTWQIFTHAEDELRYTRARTWQSCAWEPDPMLPEVQPYWD